MSTEASGLPERRFMVSPADGASGSMDRSTADRWVERTGYGTFVLELVRATEADLLRKLVAAVAEWKAVALLSDMDYDAARRVPGLEAQMVAALDALLAVAPHWGGGE